MKVIETHLKYDTHNPMYTIQPIPLTVLISHFVQGNVFEIIVHI
jgi:hypothetical protein